MKCNIERSNNLAFNSVAELYDAVRPGYPEQLYSDVLLYSASHPPFETLEIGCGTGQATVPFAKLGLNITAIEPGNKLVEIAAKNTRQIGNVNFIVDTFEDANITDTNFELIYSATAFHWIPADIAYSRTSTLLTQGGTLAIFWNLMPQFSTKLEDGVSTILKEHEPSLVQSTFGTTPQIAIQEGLEELKQSGFFKDEQQNVYEWAIELSAVDFTNLLDTFANYQVLPKTLKHKLFLELQNFIHEQLDSRVNIEYTTVLNLARKA